MQFVLWFLLPQLVGIGLVAWLYRMPDHGPIPAVLRFGWNRVGGTHRRLVQGKLWEPGEQERYRVQLHGVTIYSIDRHIPAQGRAICIVTSHRVMLDDGRARPIKILPTEIRAVRACRAYDTSDGFSFFVAVEFVGSAVHEPEGDLCLICESQEESQTLSSAIETLCSLGVRR